MCGIFGYYGLEPNQIKIRKLMMLADSRGGHAHGIVYRNKEGRRSIRGQGPMQNNKILNHLDNDLIIGQSRLASTHIFEPGMLQNVQPLIFNDMTIIHNGDFKDYQQIYSKYSYTPITSVDSEVIRCVLNNEGYQGLCDYLNQHNHAVVLLFNNNDIFLQRNNLPLFVEMTDSDFYFCSRQFEGAQPLAERKLIKLNL